MGRNSKENETEMRCGKDRISANEALDWATLKGGLYCSVLTQKSREKLLDSGRIHRVESIEKGQQNVQQWTFSG